MTRDWKGRPQRDDPCRLDRSLPLWSMLEKKKARRIVICRSCSMPQFLALVAQLRALFKDAEILVLVQRGFADVDIAHAKSDKLVIPDGFLKIWRIGRANLKALRRFRGDLFVVPYFNHDGRGYWHYVLLSWISGCGARMGVNRFGRDMDISPLRVLLRGNWIVQWCEKLLAVFGYLLLLPLIVFKLLTRGHGAKHFENTDRSGKTTAS